VLPTANYGTWRPEHLFTLKQSRQMYRHYQDQIAACDEEIEKLLVAFQPRVDPAEKPLPPDRKKRKRGRQKKNAKTKQGFDLRTESYKIFGVDLTQIPGLMAMVLTLFSEVGRDMSRWKTAGQFVSWLAFRSPHRHCSVGGRVGPDSVIVNVRLAVAVPYRRIRNRDLKRYVRHSRARYSTDHTRHRVELQASGQRAQGQRPCIRRGPTRGSERLGVWHVKLAIDE